MSAARKKPLSSPGGALTDIINRLRKSQLFNKTVNVCVGLATKIGSKLSLNFKSKEFASKSYRYLARQMVQDLSDIRTGKIILFSSPESNEEYCEILLMLALVLQDEFGARVLIVDGALKQNGITSLLGPEYSKGLLNLVHESDVQASELITELQRKHVYFMPAGKNVQSVSSFISKEKIQEVYQNLAGDFDYILIAQNSIQEDTRFIPFAQMADMVLVHMAERITPLSAYEEIKRVMNDHNISRVKYFLSTYR